MMAHRHYNIGAEGVLEGTEPERPAPVAYTFNPWKWDTFVERGTERTLTKCRRAVFLPDAGDRKANATLLEGLKGLTCSRLKNAFRGRRVPAGVKKAAPRCFRSGR
jgi:hypothetical protein